MYLSQKQGFRFKLLEESTYVSLKIFFTLIHKAKGIFPGFRYPTVRLFFSGAAARKRNSVGPVTILPQRDNVKSVN